jgi:hypothetical protein
MANIWTVPNNFLLKRLTERVTLVEGDVPLPLANTNDVNIELISGKLPPGVRIINYNIVGTPFEVNKIERYTFVLRAQNNQGIQDRTFQLTVSGADAPVWTTNDGLLPLGSNNALFVLDNEIIDFQLNAIDSDLPAGDNLEYFIANKDGELPPGITLTPDGRLTGVVEPLLALDKDAGNGGFDSAPYGIYPNDWSIPSDNGFSSFFYDTVTYDFNFPTQSPKKLNRYYSFAVTVTDGVTEPAPRREFRIYVVGDDYLRSDNSVMKVSNGVFTADNTHIRTPLWITPSELGFKRADNYVTIYLDVFDDDTLSGTLAYTLEKFNDDGSQSKLPPETSLDNLRGEIVGHVPYQTQPSKEYKFTVRATRFTGDTDYAEVTMTVYEDTLTGKSKFKVFKLPLGLADGIDDLNALRDQDLVINGKTYTVSSVDGSNDKYDEIILTDTLTSNFFIKLRENTQQNAQEFFVDRLSSFNREKWRNKILKFSNSEEYKITNIRKYREWQITSQSNNIDIDLGPTNLSPIAGETDNQKIQRIFGTGNNSVKILQVDSGNIRFIAPVKKDIFSETTLVKNVFVYSGTGNSDLQHTLVDDTRDQIKVNEPLKNGRAFIDGQTIGIGLEKDEVITKTFITDANRDINNPSSIKTFRINILGAVDSQITWNSPADLGKINANYTSVFKIDANTTLPDSKLVYQLIKGRLPNGLSLTYSGEIIGRPRQFGTPELPGLTLFDSGNTQFDNSITTFDRKYEFTVQVQDRFKYSAEQKTFTITVLDQDDTLYSNLYLQPFLKSDVRNRFRLFISNPEIFPPDAIYRPNDPEFGIQRQPRILAYAGIETKTIAEFVAAAAKNHKRRQYRIGEVKTAEAKTPGTDDVVYEVVYIEVIDPAEPVAGRAKKSFKIENNQKITVDSKAYNSENLSETVGSQQLKNRNNNKAYIENNEETFKFRPSSNTVKADSDALIVNQQGDVIRYLSNTTNMREEIEKIGKSQRDFLPLWMRTGQNNQLQELDYVTAIPLAYCKPEKSKEVLLNVKNALANGDFDFREIDLDIDRYIVDSTTDSVEEQYIVFANYKYNE